ncbi:flippase [bacterium]|nr:flippase [bacterium]
MSTEEKKPQINSTARVAKNSLVQMAAGVINKILGVALIIYAARQLGTEGFGQYTFVLSLHAIFYIFTDFGLGTLTTRDLAKHPEKESTYFTNIAALRLFLSLFAGIAMIGSVAILGHPPEIIKLTVVLALSLFFNSNIDTASSIFYAHQRMEITSSVSVVANTFRIGVSLGALAVGEGVLALIWIHFFYSVLHMTVLVGILFYFIRPEFKLDTGFWKQMLKQAYPLALANFFSIIYFRVDTVMLASMKGQEAVGLYNAAFRLLELTLLLPAYYGGAIFPVISQSYSNHQQRFLLIYRRSMKYMFLLSLPLAAGAALLAPQFIDILYKQDYAASVPVLTVLMWCLVLIAVNSINAPYLIVMGRQKIVTRLVMIGMLLNIGLNAYAIPRYGMLGAAWVTLISEGVTIAMFMLALRRSLEMRFRMLRHFLKPVLAMAVMAGLLIVFQSWDMGYKIVIGGMVYLSLLWGLKVFDEVDIEIFTRIIRPTKSGGMKLT